jgi:DNA-binding PucR family transcriptional regulator
MIDKLIDHYGKEIIVLEDQAQLNNEYYWFYTHDQKTIGFQKKQLSKKELELLSIFLQPINSKKASQHLTVEEQQWSSFLFEQNDSAVKQLEKYPINSYRFVHFSLNGEMVEQHTFIEVIKSLFPAKIAVLWESEMNGVIIDFEPIVTGEVEHLYDSIVDTINSDFYIKIVFYIGLLNGSISDARDRYQWERSMISNIKHQLKKKINYIEEMIPYLLFHEVDLDYLEQISEQILKSVLNEPELINSIKVFLDCNLNVSLAAKKLYLHRNTLQYRVDKFIEKTGIDIRQFNNAVSVYLALIMKK